MTIKIGQGKLALPIGMRYIKTALAVTLCVLISRVLRMEYPFYAVIAAVISMENTVYSSFKVGRNRMMGTAVGAFIGMMLALVQPNNALLCGLGIIIIIFICQSQGWKNAISIACIVFLAIMVNLDGKSPVLYSANRLMDTLLGIMVALAVNAFVIPYDGRKVILEHHQALAGLGCRILECLAAEEMQEACSKDQRKTLRGELNQELEALRDQFKLYREEFPLNRDLRLDLIHHIKGWLGHDDDPDVDPESTDDVLALTRELADHLLMLERLETAISDEEEAPSEKTVFLYHYSRARDLSAKLSAVMGDA